MTAYVMEGQGLVAARRAWMTAKPVRKQGLKDMLGWHRLAVRPDAPGMRE
ncbi:MAG: hypothetical protein M2R45_00788 [Verrucomicrobia subdivision 3 bacterium]|nr:hypothetical protein [Limisphaerales bacterium]MCS1413107.1 hypothetical protein [Limisphaerales bacterium]